MSAQAVLTFVVWAAILVAQNMSFTAVSRARNSGSDWYHAAWAVMSNGVWFAAFIFTFDYLTRIQQTKSVALIALVGGVYVTATVFGSVFGGRLVRKYFEQGNRRVGHYDDTAARIVQLEEQARLTARILEQMSKHLNTSAVRAASRERLKAALERAREAEGAGHEAEVEGEPITGTVNVKEQNMHWHAAGRSYADPS